MKDDFHGEVVGRGAGLVGLERNLFREIAVFIFLGLGSHRAVGVGQHTIADHPCARGDEHMVYPAGSETVGVEPVGSSIKRVTDLTNLVAIFQDAAFDEHRVDRVGLVHIEVPGQDDRFSAAHLADLLDNQFGAFHSGLDTDMIHVEAEIIEFLLGVLDLEMAPGANAVQGSVPADTRHLGSF